MSRLCDQSTHVPIYPLIYTRRKIDELLGKFDSVNGELVIAVNQSHVFFADIVVDSVW